MTCSGCGALILAEVVRRTAAGWSFEAYCEHCQKSPRCPSCHASFAYFQRERLLSCAQCYLAFAPELVLLLRRFRSKRQLQVEREGVSAVAMERSLAWGASCSGADKPRSLTAAPVYPESLCSVREQAEWLAQRRKKGRLVRLRIMRNLEGLPYASGPGGAALNAELAQILRREERFFRTWMTEGPDPEQALARLYVGDEDHFRAEWFFLEESSDKLWPALQQQMSDLHSWCAWQYQSQFGYLAACPTQSGGGVRLSLEIGQEPWPVRGARLQLARAGFELRRSAAGNLELSNRQADWPFDIQRVQREIQLLARHLFPSSVRS